MSNPPVKRIRTSSVGYGHSVNPRDRSRTRGPIHYNKHGKVTDGNHRLQEARRRGDKYIDAQCYPDSDVGHCCFRQLVKGKPRLARRLAQRWIKMQLATSLPNFA